MKEKVLKVLSVMTVVIILFSMTAFADDEKNNYVIITRPLIPSADLKAETDKLRPFENYKNLLMVTWVEDDSISTDWPYKDRFYKYIIGSNETINYSYYHDLITNYKYHDFSFSKSNDFVGAFIGTATLRGNFAYLSRDSFSARGTTIQNIDVSQTSRRVKVSYFGNVVLNGLDTSQIVKPFEYEIYGSRTYNSEDEDKTIYLPSDWKFKTPPDGNANYYSTSLYGLNNMMYNTRLKMIPSQSMTWGDIGELYDRISIKLQFKSNNDDDFSEEKGTGFFSSSTFGDHKDGKPDKELEFRLNMQQNKSYFVKFNFYDGDMLLRSDTWEFVHMVGFIDSNGDGIEDRTQKKDGDGNIISDGSGKTYNPEMGIIGGGNPNNGGTSSGDTSSGGNGGNTGGGDTYGSGSFNDYVSGVRNIFLNMWGIIPQPIMIVITGGIALLIVVGIIRVVTG